MNSIVAFVGDSAFVDVIRVTLKCVLAAMAGGALALWVHRKITCEVKPGLHPVDDFKGLKGPGKQN